MCHAGAIDRPAAGKQLCLDVFSGGERGRDRAGDSGAQTHTTRTFVTALAVLVDTRRVANRDAAAAAGLRVLLRNIRTFVSAMLHFVIPAQAPRAPPGAPPVRIARDRRAFQAHPPAAAHGTAIAPPSVAE